MQKQSLVDIYETKVKFSFVESHSEVDGKYIIAKVRGVFFVPDGKSRNGRFYPKELWENVLANPEVQQRLQNRAIFGTVGHDQPIDDKAILEGKASHIVTKLEIDAMGRGMGEALILGSNAGIQLNIVLRAGGQMFVSTRADGTFDGKENGMPRVNPKTYDFQTVDFVTDPGFLEAHPTIAESFNKMIDDENTNINNEDTFMSEALLKIITEDNKAMKVQVTDLNGEVSELSESNTTLVEENKHLTVELVKLEEANKKIKEMEDEKEEDEKEKEELEEKISKYEELADSPEELKETLEASKDFITTVNEELDGIESCKEALTTAIDFKKSVDSEGGLDSLVEAKAKIKEMEDEEEEKKKEADVKDLEESCKLSTEQVEKLLEKYTVEEVKELHTSVSESFDNSSYKKTNFKEEKTKKTDKPTGMYESAILKGSRASKVRI